jgi:hypothetical protein
MLSLIYAISSSTDIMLDTAKCLRYIEYIRFFGVRLDTFKNLYKYNN